MRNGAETLSSLAQVSRDVSLAALADKSVSNLVLLNPTVVIRIMKKPFCTCYYTEVTQLYSNKYTS